MTNVLYKRLKALFEYEMPLYCAHLPLDLHPEIGNNAVIFKKLGFEEKQEFGTEKGFNIGFKGILPVPVNFGGFLKNFEEKTGSKPDYYDFGPNKIRSAGIISGSAGRIVAEAISDKLDLFITGETSHEIFHDAEEAEINVIFGGHYNTEVFGVQELGRHLKKKFGLKTRFIDLPTGY